MISEVRSICKQIKDYKWQNHPDFKRISLDMIENTVNAAKERCVFFLLDEGWNRLHLLGAVCDRYGKRPSNPIHLTVHSATVPYTAGDGSVRWWRW